MIARAGLTQLRCAETEKYAHVTYFFNGGREDTFPGEDRKLVPSPRDLATYDKKPEMSAAGVASEVVTAIKSGKYDFILVNFANPDMVGHTGILEAAIHADEAVDKGLGAIGDAVREGRRRAADHRGPRQLRADEGRARQPAHRPHAQPRAALLPEQERPRHRAPVRRPHLRRGADDARDPRPPAARGDDGAHAPRPTAVKWAPTRGSSARTSCARPSRRGRSP